MPHFTVSLSGSSLGDCRTVLEFMQASGMSGDVTRNQSVDRSGKIEPGCRMFFVGGGINQVRQLFDALQLRHPELECAHVRAKHDEMEGCIYNVCHSDKHNQCPHYIRRCSDSKAGKDD